MFDGLECPGNGFKCRDGTCVPEHAFCNSIVDCSDGSDEPEKACKREHRYPIRKKASAVGVEQLQCPIRCRNGRCRSAAVLCTGADGCGDNSDETQCQICRNYNRGFSFKTRRIIKINFFQVALPLMLFDPRLQLYLCDEKIRFVHWSRNLLRISRCIYYSVTKLSARSRAVLGLAKKKKDLLHKCYISGYPVISLGNHLIYYHFSCTK